MCIKLIWPHDLDEWSRTILQAGWIKLIHHAPNLAANMPDSAQGAPPEPAQDTSSSRCRWWCSPRLLFQTGARGIAHLGHCKWGKSSAAKGAAPGASLWGFMGQVPCTFDTLGLGVSKTMQPGLFWSIILDLSLDF